MLDLFESEKKDITRLVLIRHGQTESNRQGRIGNLDNTPLAPRGFEQARAAAKRLADFAVDVIYASPLLRTRQTAETIAEHLGLPVKYDSDLEEYEFGVVNNHTVQELEEIIPAQFDEIKKWLECAPDADVRRPMYPGAESMTSFIRRIGIFCDRIIANHPGQIVLAVTHMAVIKGTMTYITGAPLDRHMNYNAGNASLTIIDFCKGNPVLTAFNDISHLGQAYTFGRVNML